MAQELKPSWQCPDCKHVAPHNAPGITWYLDGCSIGPFCTRCVVEWMNNHWHQMELMPVEKKGNENAD